jgi:hypothetical protein
MSLTIGQIVAASHVAVLNAKKTPENQWKENPTIDLMDQMGYFDHRSFGASLDITLDYRRNPGGDFLATDLTTTSSSKTEVLTAATYSIAELSIPVVWSKKDEVQTPTETSKVAFSKSLLTNAYDTHDDMIEEAMYAATATDGFNSFLVLIPANGQGTPGGIDAGTETMWRSNTSSYASDFSDIESEFTEVYNECAKGSGSMLAPKLLCSGSTPHAGFESTQVPMQRYADQTFKVGAKVLIFKDARYIFSQYGGNKVFFSNPKSLQLAVSKQYFRKMDETMPMETANGFKKHLYSALQLVTGNKSRLGLSDVA